MLAGAWQLEGRRMAAKVCVCGEGVGGGGITRCEPPQPPLVGVGKGTGGRHASPVHLAGWPTR